MRPTLRGNVTGLALFLGLTLGAWAEDKLLAETVDFGRHLHLSPVPGFVIGVVRNGETVVRGYGEIADGSGKAPDGDTPMRVGAITKVFCGATLATMVADGSVKFTDRLQERLDWDVTIPQRDGKEIRLIDLATHSSGLPREAAGKAGETRTSDRSKEDYISSLTRTLSCSHRVPASSIPISTSTCWRKPWPTCGLRRRVARPRARSCRTQGHSLRFPEADRKWAMRGHNFDGSPMPFIPTSPMIEGASGLYSTTNDMLRWLSWHLDRFSPQDAEMRLLDHATYLHRDGLDPAFGMDEGGTMDAMGLGWVVMQPEGNRPLIFHKLGGLQGEFSFVAFAPTRGIGVFASMNKFSVEGFDAMAKATSELITELAPR